MIDILIVEDNVEISEILSDFLKAEGYKVLVTDNGEEALNVFNKQSIGLIILDIMLPGVDGFAVCRKIREDSNTPIIIVSAKINKEDKLNGLILGADDYIEKPYDIDILLAKISGIFKRRAKGNIIIEDNIKINKDSRTAYLNNKELSLTVKEYELLLLLIENKGKTLNKEHIFNEIWGLDSFSEQQTLTVHIKWLREKIEKDPKNPKHIITVWGVGYRFVN